MNDFHVTLTGLNHALNVLDDTAGHSERVMARTNHRLATRWKDTSQEYAPRSPTVGDIRKGTGRPMKTRKASGTSRPKPGGLERSIEHQSDATQATVFVGGNAPAGQYAFRIHEEKGETWHNRGLGTISKGAKADDQFITRAAVDEEGAFFAIIVDEQDKAWKGAA